MGTDFENCTFDPEDYRFFGTRLQQSLQALRQILAQPDFGVGPLTVGAELEGYICDSEGRVLPRNKELLDDLNHPQLQLELNRFNIEYNLKAQLLAGKPFSAMSSEMNAALAMLQKSAEKFGGQVVPVGILPTLQCDDLTETAMTDLNRFRVLDKALKELRGGDFRVDIHGKDDLTLSSSQVVFEGANTSFQVHLRVEPERFADTFNALQLVTPLLVALAANSPFLLQQQLWDETRIALFKQAVDYRLKKNGRWQEPARVAFGHGWVREGAWEQFAETVALHRPIMPVLSDRSPEQRLIESKVPPLPELQLHMGSVWSWNRTIYDHHDGGHLRIEMRALPSGPTVPDMVANAALYIGLALGLRDYVQEWLPTIPFNYAQYNFYRAAQNGLDAVLVWPHRKESRLVETRITRIIEAILPYARKGLAEAGVDLQEIDNYLSIVEQRFELGRSPARWQRSAVEHFCQAGREGAMSEMFRNYVAQQSSGQPIHQWQWY